VGPDKNLAVVVELGPPSRAAALAVDSLTLSKFIVLYNILALS
jgi:hypothetical protein